MRQFPEDTESERSLLATLCAEGAEHALSMLLPSLCPEDFIHPAHLALFLALRELVNQRQQVNPLTLRDCLAKREDLAKVGDFSGLLEILGASEVSRPSILADILAKKRRQRQLIRLGQQIANAAEESAQEPDELIHSAQETLRTISQDGRRDEGEGWTEILHHMASFEPFRHGKSERGGVWGIPSLDTWAPIPSGEYFAVGARPGTGKTALMTQIAVESARKGLRPLVVTLELPKLSMQARLASYLTHLPVQSLKAGQYHHQDVSTVGQWASTLERGRIQSPTAGTPWPKIEAMIRYEVDRYGVDLVLIDQFDKIGRPAVGRGSNEAYAFGAVSTALLGLAKDLGIGLGLMAQLKGDADGREPGLADFADSDRPAKDSAVVVHLYRDNQQRLKAKIQKNRDGAWVGRKLDLDFQGESQHFREIETDSSIPSSEGVMLR